MPLLSHRPVPGVIWRRTDGKELSVRAQIRSFGLELYFNRIDYDDAGSYECDGYNSARATPVKTTVSDGHLIFGVRLLVSEICRHVMFLS